MSERINHSVDRQLEGGQGGEMINDATGWRKRLLTLATSALALGSYLDPKPTNADQTPAQFKNVGTLESMSDSKQIAPEASSSGSAPIDKHCDEIDGQKRFEGWVEKGTLKSHNYKREAYATVYKDKVYLCFNVPADEGKPQDHWTARYIGPVNWFENGKKVTSRDLNNCPTVNPCK